jgi:hypothetical protein
MLCMLDHCDMRGAKDLKAGLEIYTGPVAIWTQQLH